MGSLFYLTVVCHFLSARLSY